LDRAFVLPFVAAGWTVIGGFWTYYTWYYKEILIPSTAPVNITTQLDVKQAGLKGPGAGENGELEAIELAVTATNVSTRTIYFLSNYWVATGANVEIRPENDDTDSWRLTVNERVARGQPDYSSVGRHYQKANGIQVAWGSVFPSNYYLYPNESVSMSKLFYVPRGVYDLVMVDVGIPSTSVPNSAEIDYRMGPDGTLAAKVFRIGRNGVSTEMVPDEKGNYSDPRIGLQLTQSSRQLSLWQGTPPPSVAATLPETSP
jgi:hypothetical protein